MTLQPTRAAAPADVQPIVISTGNSFAHAYSSLADLLSEKDLGGSAHGGLEFFDRQGRRLTPVFSQTWELEGLVPTLDEPDPELVQGRLQAVVQHVADYIRRHPEAVAEFGLSVSEAIDGLPKLGGGTLAEDAAQFPGSEALSDGMQLMHSAGYWHNLLHAAGIDH